MTLAGLARETSTIRLGTLVTSATFRRPGPLAIAVAQVDAMSGGRVELGLGTGWFDTEHDAYGIPFGTFGDRFDHLAEQLEVITGLWSTPVGRDVQPRRTALHDQGLARAAQARAATASADHPRRRGSEAHACARGALRRRVQRAVPLARRLQPPGRQRARARARQRGATPRR